ncbi:MAG TPA: hypothetical protein PKL48_11305 [Thermodesulfobacteriota bacterium]|nr:hypothetical protein [Thermodesulfobacteriota bacterium]
MNVGDKISFAFGKGQKEGVVVKVCPKTIYIKCDFKNDKGKLVRRKLSQLTKAK